MTAIAKELDEKLHQWTPETAEQIEKLVSEIIQWPTTMLSTLAARVR